MLLARASTPRGKGLELGSQSHGTVTYPEGFKSWQFYIGPAGCGELMTQLGSWVHANMVVEEEAENETRSTSLGT